MSRASKSTSSLPRREAEYALPDLSNISYAEISRGTGISPSMLSRMFSDDSAQKRPNPTLNTVLALRDYLETRLGTRISLDTLVSAIR